MSAAAQVTRTGTPADRVNVLFLMIQMTGMGGSERLVLDLVRNLDRRTFAPSVGWFVGDQPLDAFKALDVPLYYFPKRKRFDWGTMRRVSRVISEHRIDVVNAHHFLSFVYAFYGARIANRARLIYTEHSENDVLQVKGKWQMLGRRLLPSCRAVGISERVSSVLTDHFRLKPGVVQTIENGVDVAVFGHGADRAGARRQLGFDDDDLVIGHVANFKRNKNHLFLLKAFHRLADRRSDVKLLLVGRGFAGDPENTESEIARYIEQNSLTTRVQVTGYRSDVHELLVAMDVFCLVSYREGMPLSLIEAMASGLPVVGTSIEGIAPVIQPDVNGLLVDPDDIESLSRNLGRLAADASLRRRMGAASRRLAESKYSLARCVDQTQQLLLSGSMPSGVRTRPEAVIG